MKRTPYTHTKSFYPHNTGTDAQANLRVMYGQNPKADNLPGGADILIDGKGYQIKSARATACHSLNPEHARTEYAEAYGFIFVDIKTETAYVLTIDEYIEMIKEFGTPDAESGKNGGGDKIRFNRKFSEQTEWLAARAS